MNILLTKKYLLKAHEFLLKNKLLFFYAFIVTLFLYIPLANYSFDPDGLISLLGFFTIYFFLGFFILLPVILNKINNKEKISFVKITQLILKNFIPIMTLTLFVAFLSGVIVLIFFIFFDLILHINLVGQTFIDTSRMHGFVFYPLGAFYTAITSFLSTFGLFMLFIYFYERKEVWKSFKQSVQLTLKHKAFFLPIALIYSLYYSITFMFIPAGNYAFIAIRGLIEAYMNVLIMIALFFLYKDNYKIDPSAGNKIETVKKTRRTFISWTLFICLMLTSQITLFLVYTLTTFFFPINDISIGIYMIAACTLLIVPLIFKLYALTNTQFRSLILLNLLAAIIIFIVIGVVNIHLQ